MKNEIKEIIFALGADVCGVANIDRFGDAPAGFSPLDLFADCRSVVVLGLALPKGFARTSKIIYGHFNYHSCHVVDTISLFAAKKIEEAFRATAVAVPCDSPYEYWDSEKMEGRGLISMKHAAVAAGLGALGKNTLLLNGAFGNLLTLGAVLLDLDLPSDPLQKSICLEGCDLCIKNCPVQALDGKTATQKLCRQNTYGTNSRGFEVVKCFRCREVCPMRYGNLDAAKTVSVTI